MNWYHINVDSIDTPALVVNIDAVESNIQKAIAYAGGVDRLRPHVKTHKTLEIAKLQVNAGIYKFKCATIPEAEMLGMAHAKDVLLAYQPQGPKVDRLLALTKAYPDTTFRALIDNVASATFINEKARESDMLISVYIDVNDGHNRSGIKPADIPDLINHVKELENISVDGLHCYDGHIRMADLAERTQHVTSDFAQVLAVKDDVEEMLGRTVDIVAGGTPSFYPHATKHQVDCSPGTWILWDQRYGENYKELEFEKAAVVMTRVISKIDSTTYCLDMGHKSIASESPYPRVHYIDHPELEQIGHSEEHMVVKSSVPGALEVGEVVATYPYHICPTVALYDGMHIVKDRQVVDQYKVIARDRKITI